MYISTVIKLQPKKKTQLIIYKSWAQLRQVTEEQIKIKCILYNVVNMKETLHRIKYAW